MGDLELSMRETLANACFQFIDYCPRRDVARPGDKGNWTGYWVLADSVKGVDGGEKQRRILDFEVQRQKVNPLMQQMLEILCASYSSLKTRHSAYVVQDLLSASLRDDYLRMILKNYVDHHYSKTVGADHFTSIKALLDLGYSSSDLLPYLLDTIYVARSTYHNDQRLDRLQALWKKGQGEVVRRSHRAQQTHVEVKKRLETKMQRTTDEEKRRESEVENLKQALQQALQQAKVQQVLHEAEVEKQRALHQMALHQALQQADVEKYQAHIIHQTALDQAFRNDWREAAQQTHVCQPGRDAQQAYTTHEIMYQASVHGDIDPNPIAHNPNYSYGYSTWDVRPIDEPITGSNYEESYAYLQNAEVSYQFVPDNHLRYYGKYPPTPKEYTNTSTGRM